jgi:exopolysaccharide production protein ExoQ
MPPVIALTLCVILVIALLRIERGRNLEASGALWVPTFWLLLCGSKPLGRWFGSDAILTVGTEEAGSLADRLVLSILIIFALLILYRRKIEWSLILKDNFWLILLFLYLGSSVLWSDFPFVSFKRWMRLCGAIPIALVVLSERSPFKALESAFRRCAYVLIPFSLLLIKYFPDFGVEYSREGTKMWVGVASQKNSLGVICALSAFLILWTFLRDWRAGAFLKTRSQAFSEGLVLALAMYLLIGFRGVYPATAIGFLIVGVGSLTLLYKMKNNVRHMATFLVLMVVVGLLCLAFGDSLVPTVTSAFNRNESFTGRSDIWRAVLDVASRNPLLGVGYGGYWGLQDERIYSTLGVREAHSGYLDVYLEVGIVGIMLLVAFLLAHHRRALRELNHAYDWGLFGICLLMMTLIHNFTESNFLRTSNYFWNVTVFLTIVLSAPCLHGNKD